METKACTQCGKSRPYDTYLYAKDGRFSVRGRCRACHNLRAKIYARSIAARVRAAQLANPYRYRKRAWASHALTGTKGRAKQKGLEFNLTIEDFQDVPDICPVLGIPIDKTFQERRGPYDFKKRDFCPSVDRIDNTKGYVKGNIVIVSNRANRLKNDATMAELEAILRFYRARNAP